MDLEWNRGIYIYKRGRAAAKYGVCSDCVFLVLRVFESQEIVVCDRINQSPIRLNFTKPVLDCSAYYPKGQLDLTEMQKMAYLLDVQPRQAGFASENEVIVRKPKEED